MRGGDADVYLALLKVYLQEEDREQEEGGVSMEGIGDGWIDTDVRMYIRLYIHTYIEEPVMNVY